MEHKEKWSYSYLATTNSTSSLIPTPPRTINNYLVINYPEIKFHINPTKQHCWFISCHIIAWLFNLFSISPDGKLCSLNISQRPLHQTEKIPPLFYLKLLPPITHQSVLPLCRGLCDTPCRHLRGDC